MQFISICLGQVSSNEEIIMVIVKIQEDENVYIKICIGKNLFFFFLVVIKIFLLLISIDCYLMVDFVFFESISSMLELKDIILNVIGKY